MDCCWHWSQKYSTPQPWRYSDQEIQVVRLHIVAEVQTKQFCASLDSWATLESKDWPLVTRHYRCRLGKQSHRVIQWLCLFNLDLDLQHLKWECPNLCHWRHCWWAQKESGIRDRPNFWGCKCAEVDAWLCVQWLTVDDQRLWCQSCKRIRHLRVREKVRQEL